MKTRILLGWFLGMVLVTGTIALGIAQNAVNPVPPAASPDKTGTAVLSPALTNPAAPAPRAEPASKSTALAPAASSGLVANPPPAILSKSPWFYEIERLARAKVDDTVILAYINNTAGTFNLTADQVIYLKNLGLSPQMINTMIDHDQELSSGARLLTASTPPPFPPSVQAAFAAGLHPASGTATPAVAPPPASAAPQSTIIAPDDDSDLADNLVWIEPDDVPDQPASAGPVRMPYPVKLNDPIVILRLPSFTVPYW